MHRKRLRQIRGQGWVVKFIEVRVEVSPPLPHDQRPSFDPCPPSTINKNDGSIVGSFTPPAVTVGDSISTRRFKPAETLSLVDACSKTSQSVGVSV